MANEITSIKIGNVEYPINFRTNSYNYTNGTLVKLNVEYNANAMMHVHIIGNAFTSITNSKVINTIVEFYNYSDGSQILSCNATHFGYNFGDIKIFNYDSKVCLWFKGDHDYMSFSVYANRTNSDSGKNLVLSISNAAMPTSGVTRLITLTPKQISYSDHTHNFPWNNNDTNLETILSNLQAQITANANAIQNKSDIHDHNYISSTTTRAKNTVLAGPTTGSNAAPTFRALVAADIPELPATKITSEKLDIARIPTGTTSTTVALGNHTHDGRYYTETEINTKLDGKADTDHTHPEYATVEQLDESELATAEALNDLDTRVDALESNPGGTYVTDDDQEWSGVKTFLDGIRIGDDANPGSLESNRTIYFGDGEYTYITEVPSDQLALKGNKINLNASTTLTNKAIFPETTNYKPISLPATYTVSNTRYSSAISFSRYCSKSTFATVGESSYNIYIQGSNEYYGIWVAAGYTVEINVGAGYTAYRDTLLIDSGYECPDCRNLIEYTVQPFLDRIGSSGHRIRYYLTESSSSTTPISGTEKDINISVDGYTSYNNLTISGSTTYAPVTQTIKYTNTGTSGKTVYLKGKLLRLASSSITISSPESGYWRYTMEEGSDIEPSSWYIYPACEYCGTSFNSNTRALMWAAIGSGKTFYTYFKNITTYHKYTTYKANTTFSLPSLDMSAYGPVSVLSNGIVAGTHTTFDNTNLASNDKGLINTTTQLCYKFADALSGFLVDSNQLSYISGASTDVSICPSRIFDITASNGLTFAQGSSGVSPQYMFNTKNGIITLGYYPGSSNTYVELSYNYFRPNTSGSFTLGSSSNKLGTIYSTSQINTSDERFKNWISDIDIDFEKLKKIPKKLFTWRDSFLKDDDDIHIGTSAQVIRDIYPEIVHVYNSDVDFCPPRDIYDPDAVLAIEYDKLGVIALAAVDKLHEENVQLKEENEQLKTRLDNLEAILKEKGIL